MKAAEISPDVPMLDISMSGMSGIDAARQLKSSRWN
jgi:CheY-like chemotaxis protein